MSGTNYNAVFNNVVKISLTDENDKATQVECFGDPNAVALDVGIYTNGCILRRTDLGTGSVLYSNTGTISIPSWTLFGGGGGGVASVTASLPLTSSGGANPNIAINQPIFDHVWYTDNAGILTGDGDFTRDSTTHATMMRAQIGNDASHIAIQAANATLLHSNLTSDLRLVLDGTNARLGDTSSAHNDTVFTVDDINQQMIASVSSNFQVVDPTGAQTALMLNLAAHTYAFGDLGLSGQSTTLTINDTGVPAIYADVDGLFEIRNTAHTTIAFVTDSVNGLYGMGDTTQVANGTRFFIFDLLDTMDFQCKGVARFGDVDALGTNGYMTVDNSGASPRTFMFKSTFGLYGYTVATLPAGTIGDTAYCTDLLLPTYLGVAVGGGAVVAKVFFNGANWIT